MATTHRTTQSNSVHGVPDQRHRQRLAQRLGLALIIGVTGANCIGAIPHAQGATATALSYSYEGEGRTRGFDFAAKGTGTAAGLGAFTIDLQNDPSSTAFLPPANGRLVMTNALRVTLTAGTDDRLYGLANGTYSFALGKLPDGSPGPDLSKDTEVTTALEIVGGTGRFAGATGTLTETGTIFPAKAPSADPTAESVVTFKFAATGSVVTNSGGGTTPARFTRSDATRRELVASAKPLPTTRGPLSAGVYTAEFPNWNVTIRVPEGWRNNGFTADSIGLTNGPLTPSAVGLVVLDNPWIVDNTSAPNDAQPMTVNVRDWLRTIDGMQVDVNEPTRAGAPGTAISFAYAAPRPQAAVVPLFFLPSVQQFVPFFSGAKGRLIRFRAPGGNSLLVLMGGGTDPSSALDAQLIDVQRR